MPLSDPHFLETEELAAIFALEGIKGFGPQKFKELHAAGIRPSELVDNAGLLPTRGKRGDTLRQHIHGLSAAERDEAWQQAHRQLAQADRFDASVLTYNHPHYPRNVYESNNPIPVLFASGPTAPLTSALIVACVGSRGIREPYAALHRRFAESAYRLGFAVVSGFALGADTIGHRQALQHDAGHTVCVMPGGLQRVFPPENLDLWNNLRSSNKATFVSEFRFGRIAAGLTLRKRNKTIAAFARGVLISQSAARGGAMNAYRFALEQKKPVATFRSDRKPDTSGNAEIATTLKVPTDVFELDSTEAEYSLWLSKLSSLI